MRVGEWWSERGVEERWSCGGVKKGWGREEIFFLKLKIVKI